MKLLLADDEVMSCETLAETLKLNTSKFYSLDITVWFAHTLHETATFLQQPEEEDRPDFVFLDLDFKDGIHHGSKTIDKFLEINTNKISTIILTATAPRERESIENFKRCNYIEFMRGIFLKNKPLKWHYEGLKQIFSGGPFWYPDEIRIAIGGLGSGISNGEHRSITPNNWRLTKREWQVANQISSTSLKLSSIADDLDMSHHNCRKICSTIYEKMGVHNRIAATILIQNARKENPDLGLP